jgi:hypothetical protein
MEYLKKKINENARNRKCKNIKVMVKLSL